MFSIRFQVSAILVLLAGFLILLPESRQSSGELNVHGMLEAMNESGQSLSVDQVARMVVNEDTTMLLVDVRDPDAYRAVHIPGAINIPVSDILNPDWSGYLNDPEVRPVFYSNGNTLSSEAWMLCTQKGYAGSMIMQDGMNEWYREVMESTFTGDRINAAENARFEVRYRARDFFTRMNSMPDSLKTTFLEVKRKKEAELVGGCE
ncbi:MAG: rhodanese-like domain-containing protein [Bacteroidales bacterium]|nr:rhodanese-like domain-containing protein [Bacteroidales bacterium]